MWKGPGPDPGGGSAEGPPPPEMADLKDQFEQQQVLIGQLKEMLGKNITQEKVDEYVNTLSKRGKGKKKGDGANKKTVEIPASQKISLLRQQVEENKARLAERGKSQKGIEEMVTQLKAQLDDSQQLISQSPLNLTLQDAKIEYSEKSSSHELYTILLSKEKRISDLVAKVQKLESNVIDLQENVKEKDCVIEARTKAITLMTESLAKKGKNTLDTLDETKEQMRKMQENFIAMEEEMKARQVKLLDDLRLKNYEIAELQETNSSLEQKIEELKQVPEDPSEELQALREENSKLLQSLSEKDSRIKELLTQLEDNSEDEVNKLKKQLEESNKNMIKVKAQHKAKVKELNKKIDAFKKISDANAEIVKLETENARLTQKIAELEEEKGSLQLKLVESDMKPGSEVAEQKSELEDKNRELEEKDKIISLLEQEIARSKTEITTLTDTLSHLEAQVTSEMASIQYEERMDSLEKENKRLSTEAANEKQTLLEDIEQLKKDKQEMSTKLDHYIQENMELVDKLEKLSAEKVSSAESIEIVEGLTQQEKLELAAYQKNIDRITENLKTSEENLPQVDLNESVNELNEETSELLQRIELFTVERREVMEKMEQLKQENLELNLKIKEVENNRDVLVETYEQLQSEKDVLDSKLEAIETENSALKNTKEDPERIKALEEEIAVHKNQLQQLEHMTNLVKSLESQLEEKQNENTKINNSLIDLNRTLADLENDNKSLETKITQLEDQINNLNQQIDKNQEELEAVSNTEWENQRLLQDKDNEITKLIKERDNTLSVLQDLQKTIKDKEENFQKVTNDLKNRYQNLQKQLEENSGNLNSLTAPLESKIEELTAKNKEQLEKMKKIAANLKKKNQAYQELEEQVKEAEERHQVELKTSLQQLNDLEAEVGRLNEENVKLQNVVTDLKVKADKSNEVNLQQELLLTKENLGSVESSLRAKIQELEMIVETQESELVKSRERVLKLEEGIAYVEERRLSLERKANELGAQLQEKESTCEEMNRSEDFLEQRLAALTAHDEAIERKLEEAVVENQELIKENRTLLEKNERLHKRMEELERRIEALDGADSLIEELQAKNEDWKKRYADLQNELKEYERALEETKTDFEKVNADWQAQFEEVLSEKSELMIRCEKFEEEIKDIMVKESGFTDELIDYKTKLESSEAEIEEYQGQVRTGKEELQVLKQELEEKEETIRGYEERLAALVKQIEELSAKPVEEPKSLASFFDNVPEDSNKLEEEIAASKAKVQEMQSIIQEMNSQQPNPVPTFVWSGQSNDAFDFVQNQDNSQDLQDKLKTLEFMVYNAEKEKEEALMQCQQLTNELTRLIYEKQTQVESQIEESDSTKLQDIEFEKTQQPTVHSPEGGPVVEEACQKKHTYECEDEDEERVSTMESQILQDVPLDSEVRKDLQKIEFEETTAPVQSSEPVEEKPCEAREAYVCFGENDDGWAWGPEEAKSEEEHAHRETISILKTKIQELENEKTVHLEEIKQLQIKTAKLVKKLKELKLKNEEMSQQKKSEESFFGLEDAIQDELKLQIQQVEKKLKEVSSELEKERHEKAAIAKRVDVLTSANERMVEMKEKQDIELLGWQQNCRDLNAKLEKFEWGNDDFSQQRPEVASEKNEESLENLTKRIEELNETVKELTLDNEELQTLLEEQRSLRLQAEKNVHHVEDVDLRNQLALSAEEKRQMQEQINELIRTNTELSQRFEALEQQNKELAGLQTSKEEIIEQLTQRLAQNEAEKDAALNNIDLVKQLEEKNAEIEKQSTEKKLVEKEKEDLLKELQEKNALVDSLRESINQEISLLKQELETQTKLAESLLEEKKGFTETMSNKEAQIVQLSAAMEQMTQEWTMRIDQRGADVAESWKLHLETRESEFSQIEQVLKKEICELEEKINALVNENNELRKNVDAEIRNEVDRVAALQQQINDRQQYINELTQQLQQKQDELKTLQIELETTKKYLDDESEIVEDVVKVLEVSRNKESIVKAIKENENLVVKLREEIEDLNESLFKTQQDHSRSLEEIESLRRVLEERNQKIAELEAQMQEAQSLKALEQDSLVQSLSTELEELKSALATIQSDHSRSLEEVERLQYVVQEREAQIQQMQNLKVYEHENVQNLQQNLMEYQQVNADLTAQLQSRMAQLEEKERQLANLHQAVQEKEREHGYAVDNLSQEYRASIHDQNQEIETLKRRLMESEALLQNKDSELEEIRLQINSQSEFFASRNKDLEELTSQLQSKIEECAGLQQQINEQNALVEEENKQLTEQRAIIEEQVLKIEELKTELFQKSNDYDSLVAEMDISSVKEESRAKSEESDLTEPVSRAELDLALYMLHQRDVRCEELTVELTQLLEERDTLQLRLSNVLREKEQLARKTNEEKVEEASKTEVGLEAFDPLTTKLSELRTVGYKKDKTIVDEQESRRMQQLSIMQQHRDEAAKLPPEAAARLVDASYTLSRDVQSPSKVLLNWLWGRSTPKVNNI